MWAKATCRGKRVTAQCSAIHVRRVIMVGVIGAIAIALALIALSVKCTRDGEVVA